VNFAPVQNFMAVKPMVSREGEGQARMHQHSAQSLRVGLPGLIAPCIEGLGEAYLSRVRTAVDEIGCILQDEDWPLIAATRAAAAAK
jgi:hypothetical protein